MTSSRLELKYRDRKSTRLNSSHLGISYAVFCLKKKKKNTLRSDTSEVITPATHNSDWSPRLSARCAVVDRCAPLLLFMFVGFFFFFFFFNDTATTEIYTLSLHDALPISLDSLPLRSASKFPETPA